MLNIFSEKKESKRADCAQCHYFWLLSLNVKKQIFIEVIHWSGMEQIMFSMTYNIKLFILVNKFNIIIFFLVLLVLFFLSRFSHFAYLTMLTNIELT